LFLIIIVVFREINEKSVIDAVLGIAAYTYGPLLGLFSFGIFTRLQVRDKLVPLVCILSPIICYVFSIYAPVIFNGYRLGLEVLLINGIVTFLGLALISKRGERVASL
jgi:hypothetical protein